MNIINKIKSFFSKKKKEDTEVYYARSYKIFPYKSHLGKGNRIQFIKCRKDEGFYKITTRSMYATIEDIYNKTQEEQVIKQPYSIAIRY